MPARLRMDVEDAAALIARAVPHRGGTWADLGAGSGTFTLALASLLGPEGKIYAVDRDASALRALAAAARRSEDGAEVIPLHADFTQPLPPLKLDGTLLANALHFVPVGEQSRVLAAIAGALLPDGRVVLVDYEGRKPTRWVPFPVSFARFREISAEIGLRDPAVVGVRRSAYGGSMYAACASK